MRRLPILAIPLLLAAAGCASAGGSSPPGTEHGWLGGRWAAVTPGGRPEVGAARVTGLPVGVCASRGALLVSAEGSPLGEAGLVPGDLVLSVAGRAVGSGDDVRAAAEDAAPGSLVPVTYWRDRAVREAAVRAGREVRVRRGTVGIGLRLSPAIDLWPFDDGIDVLGLLRIRSTTSAPDLSGPEAAYLRAARPGEPVEAGPAGAFDVWLAVVGAGVEEQVVEQSP